MNGRTLGLIITGLVLGGLLALAMVPGLRTGILPETATVTGKALIGGPFTLTDQAGKRVTEKDFLGHPMLVFFGYTHCPDVCPSGLQVMAAALDKLGAKGDKVTPVFITFDGERDTPDIMAEYVKSFHPRLIGLTGNKDEIAAAAKAYRVFYQRVPSETGASDYTFDHTAIMYLMGADGNFITHIPNTTNVDQVVSILDKALP